jgi:transcription elongation GreA/GreB family factor
MSRGCNEVSEKTVGEVAIGSWVRVTGFVPGVETVFRFVCDNEVDWKRHKVPQKGPLWDALSGAKVGTWVLVDLGGGETVQLKILEVGRD